MAFNTRLNRSFPTRIHYNLTARNLKDTVQIMTQPTSDIDKIVIRKKHGFLKIAHDPSEYLHDVCPNESLIEGLKKRNADLFTFIERSWCSTVSDSPKRSWVKDNIALVTFDSYKGWIKKVTKITPNNPVNRALKRGVVLKVAEPDEALAKGIAHIYNETPIRQGRKYPFYGMTPKDVAASFKVDPNTIYITANLGDEVIGFLRVQIGDNLAMIDQGLSMEAHMDKGVTRALMAKAVEISADHSQKFLMYGRIGNHPSLDRFKRLNGFEKCEIRRFYIPLTAAGRIAVKLGLQRDLKDATPTFLKKPLYPVYNFFSRISLSFSSKKKSA